MDLPRYIHAITAYGELLKQAGQVKAWFEESGGAVPEELKAFLGTRSPQPRPPARFALRREEIKLKPPTHPFRQLAPPESEVDWIAVNIRESTLLALTLGLIRSEGVKTLAELQDAVHRYLPNTVANSVYNVVNRLVGANQMTKDGTSISLTHPSEAPLIKGELLWGNPGRLGDSDVAWFRRKVIHAFIESNPGIELMPMVRVFNETPWFPRKFTKDTLKSDLLSLQTEKRVRRSSDGRGWVATEKEVASEKATP